ncbi:3-oxoacyl-[acyl-carrier-protein] reductase FabG, partial [Tanacetum coccineum]
VSPIEDAYSYSKACIVTLTKVMAMEMATHNIRVNTIGLGIFKSEITEGLMQKKWITIVAQRTVPLRTYLPENGFGGNITT